MRTRVIPVARERRLQLQTEVIPPVCYHRPNELQPVELELIPKGNPLIPITVEAEPAIEDNAD